MKHTHVVASGFLAIALAAGYVAIGAQAWAQSSATQDASGQDAKILADAQKSLSNSRFKNITITVQNGVVSLKGTVPVYFDKSDAERKVHHVKGIRGIDNQISVGGENVPDSELQRRLVEKLQYDRVGYGNVFNAIGVSVQNGVVTLKGTARTPVDKDSALALVGDYPGVKDVVDEIEVQPPSPMDDQIRLAVARAVYGFPSLNKYAIDPAKPIRISVENGHVALYGVVDSQADKDAANIRANGVPGVFSVKNYLVVSGQQQERK